MWFALCTRSQREKAAKAWLARHGVEAWYPVRYRYTKHGPRRQRREWRIAPGYVFARFHGQPEWSTLFAHEPGARWFRGVVGVGARPIAIRPDQMAAVAGMPQRLLDEERVMREEAARLARVDVGTSVRIMDGAFEGFVVDVREVTGSMARLLLPLFGHDHEVWCATKHLVRVG